MSISIKASPGTNKTLVDVGRHLNRHRKALRLALKDVGSDVVSDMARFILTGPKTGRIYVYNGRAHQASAPGESPANRTGKLAASGDYKVRGYYEMVVGETAEYAGYLEHGTYKMAPRPHIIRAVNKNRMNTIRTIENNVKQEIGG